MSFLDEVRKDREDLARVLKKHKGIRRTVEELYPDTAHFIYELLQNAEDTRATKASFVLNDSALNFEHNGRPFSEPDVWAITDIGEGTKATDEDKIGRFGVGFKAVFAYTETPRIWSPTFSFEISDLVLPIEIPASSDLGQKTRFEFPFNNPKKSPLDARTEVSAGLEELAETTLLFLTHLDSIHWQVGNTSCEALRVPHSENHIEILKQMEGRTTAAAHFLRFTKPVLGMEKQCVAIAFALDHLPNITGFDQKLPLAKQLRIVPANPGRVAVFFPAEKEDSRLRFHLHAPFVPELSRASVKDTAANDPLFQQLAVLAASTLHRIRKLDLLNADFLGVLPNNHPDERIPPRYQPIRAALIDEMNNEPLTPSQGKSHAPARNLLQGKASLKDLLSAADIEFLVESPEEPPQWAIGAAQKNSNADRFLSSLAIRKWDIDKFVERLAELATAESWQEPDEQFMQWLAAKPVEWHQQLYALLYRELNLADRFDRLDSVRIIRLSDGTYSIGKKCFFPSTAVKHDDILPRVAEAVYSSGNSKLQQGEARKLLEAIGVKEVGESEQVQAILERRYTHNAEAPSEKTHFEDLKRFISLVEKEPKTSKLFASFHILQAISGMWRKPEEIFLDDPYLTTGLRAYYQELASEIPSEIAQQYALSGISTDKLRQFAESVGVQTRLNIQRQSTHLHPSKHYLRADYYGYNVKWTSSAIDEDWILPGLRNVLRRPSLVISQLVWKTLTNAGPQVLGARFRPNRGYVTKEAPSSLMLTLQQYPWIPQSNGSFARPPQACSELLPSGFPFDPGEPWLKAVLFGEDEEKRSAENKQRESTARILGFSNAETLERAKKFAKLPQEEQERFLAEFERKQRSTFPVHEPRNPERRDERVGEQAENAPDRLVEQRTRSVSIGREAVKEQTVTYLREQYTNTEGEMFCQVCKAAMPFKLEDGSFYFETVEFLSDLKKRHYQNYIALCPNHAAMFLYANGSLGLMRSMLVVLATTELDVILAQEEMTIQFTKTHIADLKRIINADEEASGAT
jgi:hypothetical protein